MKGYIPRKVVAFVRSRAQTHQRGGKCKPAFYLADRTVDKGGGTLFNARHWARYYGTAKGDPLQRTFNNTPKTGYRLVGFEQRRSGGLAWKVITPDDYLVDLRDDVFLPILLTKGLPADGVIDATLQWCQLGSHLRLEEVGSERYKQYRTSEEQDQHLTRPRSKSRKKTIPARDLVVGGIYEFCDYGQTYWMMYLGRARVKGRLKTMWADVPPDQNGFPTDDAVRKYIHRVKRQTWSVPGEVRERSGALKLVRATSLGEEYRQGIVKWETGSWEQIPNEDLVWE